MSKNIAIQEGGVGRQFTADKLKTALVGGGSCNWVPEDEVGLSTLSVTENGTYSATDDGSYGYSQVTVNVPGGAGGPPGGVGSSIKGVDPTTGNENLVTVDENGNIETVEIPSYIAVDTPPTKVIYDDGDTIDYTGMVVKAYKKSGELWESEQYPNGIIPINELELPQTAVISGHEEGEWTDGKVNARRITYSAYNPLTGDNYYPEKLGVGRFGQDITVGGSGGFASLFLTRYGGHLYAARETGNNSAFNLISLPDGGLSGGTSYKTIVGEFAEASWEEYITEVPESTVNPSSRKIDDLRPVKEKVSVKWVSPYDSETLETSFDITVLEA